MQSANILVVDDTVANLQLLCSILQENGLETRPVRSGKSALMAASAELPDLILLDISMPDMDGYSVCEALKAVPMLHDVPVIFISALSEALDKVRAFGVGGVDYITKPFHAEEVIARVQTQLRLARQRAELQQRYAQIQQLQAMVQQFVSQSAWARIEAAAEQNMHGAPELHDLTIMFTDIAGYTALSERTDLNKLAANLSIYMATLTQIIHAYRGEIDKYLGDGIFAFFATPTDAVSAALAIQACAAMPTRIALATGSVLMMRMGGGVRHEYTLIGDRVNVAARLQSEVNSGGIIMDEATFCGAGLTDADQFTMLSLRGKASPEPTYALYPQRPMHQQTEIA